MTMIDTLPTLDPFTAEYEADPHAVHRRLLAAGPVCQHPFGIAVLGYHEVQAVLRDRHFVNPPGLALSMYGVTDGPVWDRVATNILNIEGDEHARLRRLVAKSFTPNMADALRLRMREAMKDLLSGTGEQLDVVELVRTYPIAVICSLLGAPRQDWDLVSRCTEDTFRVFRSTVKEDLPVIEAAMDQMDAYIDGLVEQRHREGLLGDDLVTQLIRAEEEGDRLTHDELRMLVSTMFGAGTDTTRNQLAAGVQAFAEHPDQWALLRAKPDLLPHAVDELVRHDPIALGVVRVATADAVVGGVEVPAGTFVNVMLGAANRDPSVYDDPDRFDITRRGAAPHQAFGGGIHYCLGVHLARAEMAEALGQMVRRWATIELDGPTPWKPRVGVTGPASLPVRVARW